MITQQELKELLDYNPDTGVFTWKISKGGHVLGSIAGSLDKVTGRKAIIINYKRYLVHRLAWLYMTGNWPEQQIDHINGDPDDNRISNLRDISHRDNMCNLKNHREGELVGCNYATHAKKWRAHIKINGKQTFLGYFATEQEAHNAYQQRKDSLCKSNM